MDKYLKYLEKNNIIINEMLIESNIRGGGKQYRYAIVTLLMMGDNYLPGCLVLAKSILEKTKPNNIDLVCMVTPDVTLTAKNDLKKYYDVVLDVDYISIDPNLVYLKNPKIKQIYSNTFTKLHCLNLTNYNKILLIDSDMIVLDEKIFSVFEYDTPCAVFVNCESSYKNLEKFKKLYKKYIKSPGKKVNKKMYHMNCDDQNTKDKPGKIFVESSICLLSPSTEDYENMLKMLEMSVKEKEDTYIAGDTNLLNTYYKYKWHFMNYKYLGRWIDPDNTNYYVLDLYGFDGKPWQTDKYQHINKYIDVRYWVKKYISFYENDFINKCEHADMKKLYDFYLTV
jgi:alpha-N-acetylglucosamine transferase